jgi:integrase
MPKEVVHRRREQGKPLTAKELTSIERAGLPAGVERLTIKDGRAGGVRGLELRLTAQGGRSWALSQRFGGQQRRWTLSTLFAACSVKVLIDEGKTEVTKVETLAEARAVAEWLKQELKKGRDPSAKAPPTSEPPPQPAPAMTLGKLLDEYERIERPHETTKSWAVRRAHVEREYRAFINLPATDLTHDAIEKTLDEAKARSSRVSGARGLQYLRPILSWAVDKKHIAIDPVDALGADKIKKLRKSMRHKDRDRILDVGEIVALWRAWEAEPECHYGRLMRFALLTGQRRSECAAMRWEDVDLGRREWRQTENKSSRPVVVPLSTLALEVMGEPGRGLVFPSRGGSSAAGSAGNWSRAMEKYSTRSGVQRWTVRDQRRWTVHDIRRTFASLLAELKVDRTVVELLLNHSNSSAKGGPVAAIYNRHSYATEKAEAVERLARHLRGLIGGGTATNVIELRRASPEG